MKTKEEWVNATIDACTRYLGGSDAALMNHIEQIKLDAAKRGMEIAADLCGAYKTSIVNYQSGDILQSAILTARDNLKPKDLE